MINLNRRDSSSTRPLRVVLLTGLDDTFITELLKRIRQLPGIEFEHIIHWNTRRSRWKSLQKNLKKDGLLYLLWRPQRALYDNIVSPLLNLWDHIWLARPVDKSLFDTCNDLNIKIHRFENLHSPEGIQFIKSLDCDILAVCGTGILRKSVFSIPHLGTINLHQGEAPFYRGAPPGFWELWNGEDHAGVTVHFIDEGIDTGDIICQSTVPIFEYDTLASVQAKLQEISLSLYPKVISSLATGEYSRTQQSKQGQQYYFPTLGKIFALHLRILGKRMNIARLFGRVAHYPGYLLIMLLERLKQIALRASGTGTLSVLYYHRVSDICRDGMTISVGDFEKQIRYLKKHYAIWTALDLKRCMQNSGQIHGSHNVLITFDDGYEDNYINALPILQKHGCSAIFFVSTGLIDTDLAFGHDKDLLPRLRFQNMTWDQLEKIAAAGITIGVHSHTHADLGKLPFDLAREEIDKSIDCFVQHFEKQPEFMSFPFGKRSNYTEALVHYVRRHTPVRGLFSALGHINLGVIDRYNIQRINIGTGDTGLVFAFKLRGGIRDLFLGTKRPVENAVPDTPRITG